MIDNASVATNISFSTFSNTGVSVINLLPVLIVVTTVIAIVWSVLGFSSSSDSFDEEFSEEVSDKEVSDKVRACSAEEILRRRYARGDITTEEFDERMAHI